MSLHGKKAFILYCSPAGTTRHVSAVLEKELKNRNADVLCADICKEKESGNLLQQIRQAAEQGILFIASPVYVNRPLPQIMKFIEQLPEKTGAAVPIVTWGCVSSGIALYDMGKALKEKNIPLLGAAKVGAQHSMMWRSENPLGKGRPGPEDDNMLRGLTDALAEKLNKSPLAEIPLSALAYQPPERHAEMEKLSLAAAKSHMPERKTDENLCTQCGICAEECPVAAITLSPWPVFADHCICCFNCVRICPETAILSDMSPLEERIRSRAALLDEKPRTQLFL
ncbi:MAG: EFR1 family ferrodoxin [Desulfococcaceae bacterium]|jgi:ferredoxin/flavodoxin|nr:EFR1 family ferrodoxin [Desulfococcaceae bacterium]